MYRHTFHSPITMPHKLTHGSRVPYVPTLSPSRNHLQQGQGREEGQGVYFTSSRLTQDPDVYFFPLSEDFEIGPTPSTPRKTIPHPPKNGPIQNYVLYRKYPFLCRYDCAGFVRMALFYPKPYLQCLSYHITIPSSVC